MSLQLVAESLVIAY